MILRIEWIKSKSGYYGRVMDVCKKLPTFKEDRETFSVELTDKQFDTAQAVIDMVGHWKGTAFYMDGILTSHMKARRIVWDSSFYDYRDQQEEAARRRALDRRIKMQNKIKDAKTPNDLLGE